MAEFLLLVREDEAAHDARPPLEAARLIEARAHFVAHLRERGHLRDCGRFRPSREGLRLRRGATVRGPFTEADGRALGAWYWVEAPSFDVATQLAGQCPVPASDAIEVRPVMKGVVATPDKEGKPGKIYGFGVLGSAPTEAAWVAVMDRIDQETSAGFPADTFLGGLRLHPPERRAVVDGPFLESKEVIGGLFFLRVSSEEDAVRWAAQTPFVVHGTLELRELWRT